jgi:hypothetical protein
MNTVYRERQPSKTSPTHTLGHTRNSINVLCRAVEVISREMSHVQVKRPFKRSILNFAMHPRSQPNGRNAEVSIVLRSGLKASGENVLLHAVKMEHESVKFIVKSLKLMGELMTIVYCITFIVRVGKILFTTAFFH